MGTIDRTARLKEISEQLETIRGKVPGIAEGVKSLKEAERQKTLQTSPFVATGKGAFIAGSGTLSKDGVLDILEPPAPSVQVPKVEDMKVFNGLTTNGFKVTSYPIQDIDEPIEGESTSANYLMPKGLANLDFNQVYTDLLDRIETERPDPIDMRNILEQEYEKWGVKDFYQQLQSVQTQALSSQETLRALDDQEQQEIDAIIARPGVGMNFQTNSISKVKYDSARRKADVIAEWNSYNAQSQVLQNNLSLARTFANDYVNAAVYSYEQEAEKFEIFMEQNIDAYNTLSENYQDALDEAVKASKDKAELEREEKEFIADLATSPSTAAAFVGVNWNSLTKEDAVERAKNYLAVQAIAGGEDLLSVAEAKSLGVPYGTTRQQAIDLGIIPTTGTSGADDAKRIQDATAYMRARQGGDEKIAWETYVEAAQNWIGAGGTPSDFKFSFPPETLMDELNIAELPSIYKASVSDLFNSF